MSPVGREADMNGAQPSNPPHVVAAQWQITLSGARSTAAGSSTWTPVNKPAARRASQERRYRVVAHGRVMLHRRYRARVQQQLVEMVLPPGRQRAGLALAAHL